MARPWMPSRGRSLGPPLASLEKRNPLQPFDNPFGTRLSPMSSVRSVTYVSGLDN